jgi:hypothetical protein
MQASINENKFIVTLTLTRIKASILVVVTMYILWTFINSFNKSNTYAEIPKPGTVVITEPVLSPYNLTPETKSVLKNWLHYGYENGYSKMMSEYTLKNGNSETSKMFRYLIDSEWRLGGWEEMSKNQKK